MRRTLAGEAQAAGLIRANAIGAWSSLSTAILTVGFVIATILFSPTEWRGLDAYISNYSQREVLIWIPCFLFALSYLMTVSAVASTSPDERKIFDYLSLALGVTYSLIVFLNAYLQLTVLRLNILSGRTGGLDLLALPNPHSVTYALEGLGYAFLGLSTLFLSFVLGSTRLELAIRALLIVNAAVGIFGLFITVLDIPLLMLPGIGIWCIEYPIANFLLFVFFRRRLRSG